MKHFFSVLPISQSIKIKLEGKFELGSQVNKIVKDLTKRITERGGPLESLTVDNDNSGTEEVDNAARIHQQERPLLQEFLKSNGERFHVYGVHQSSHKHDDTVEQSNIMVRKKGRRRNGIVLII